MNEKNIGSKAIFPTPNFSLQAKTVDSAGNFHKVSEVFNVLTNGPYEYETVYDFAETYMSTIS